MRFPRNAKIFRGQLDGAPMAGVFFLLVLFLLLASLTYTPGVKIHLPVAENLAGAPGPSVAVAVDSLGKFYFENQLVSERELVHRLKDAAKKHAEPLTLIVHADKSVDSERVLQIALLAREAGVRDALWATLPKPFDSPGIR